MIKPTVVIALKLLFLTLFLSACNSDSESGDYMLPLELKGKIILSQIAEGSDNHQLFLLTFNGRDIESFTQLYELYR